MFYAGMTRERWRDKGWEMHNGWLNALKTWTALYIRACLIGDITGGVLLGDETMCRSPIALSGQWVVRSVENIQVMADQGSVCKA